MPKEKGKPHKNVSIMKHPDKKTQAAQPLSVGGGNEVAV
jgi:hypothetical protein